MDPATTFCPRLACPARGQTGQGNIGIHSRKDTRFLCTACHKTFSATKGSAFYRIFPTNFGERLAISESYLNASSIT